MRDDKRLLEDYLPIVAISAEASRETIRVGSLSYRGDLGLAEACHAAGPSKPPCIPPS